MRRRETERERDRDRNRDREYSKQGILLRCTRGNVISSWWCNGKKPWFYFK